MIHPKSLCEPFHGLIFRWIINLMLFIQKGLSVTVNSYMSNLAGGGKTEESKNFLKIALAAGVFISVINWTVAKMLKGWLQVYFTTDAGMCAQFSQVYDIGTNIFLWGDNLVAILQALLRSLDQQKFACYAILGIYHMIGLPIVIIVGHILKYRLIGIVYSFSLTTIFLSLVLLCKLVNLNFHEMIARIKDRISKQEKEQNKLSIELSDV